MQQPLRTAIVYSLLAGFWIIITDRLLGSLVGDRADLLASLSVAKGILFVIGSAIALFLLLRLDLRQHKRDEAALSGAERQFQHLFARNPLPMWIFDPVTLRFLDVNEAAVMTYGYTRDEFLAMTIADIRPPDEILSLMEGLRTSQQNLVRTSSTRHRYKNGEIHVVEIVTNSVAFQGRDAMMVVIHDVTEASHLQQELFSLNRRLQLMIDASPLALVAVDPEGNVMFWSPAAEQMFGWTQAEVLGKPLPYLPDGKSEESILLREQLFRGESLPPTDLQRQRKDGTLIDVRLWFTPLLGDHDEVIGQFAAIRDMSDEKRINHKLSQLAAIVQATDDAIISKTPNGIILSWNPGAERMYGYTAEEIIGQHISVLVPPERYAEIDNIIAQLREGKRIHHMETFRVRKDGQRIAASLSFSPILENDMLIAIAVIARDVTERTRDQQQLAYQASLLDQVSDAIISLDFDGTIRFWNRGAERLYGWSADEVTGKRLGEFLETVVVHDTMENAVLSVSETGYWSGEYRQTRKDGMVIPVLNATTRLHDADGNPAGYVGINRDISERKRLEVELAANQKLQSDLEQELENRQLRERFLSMVSHEFRTPLAIIQSATDMLRYYGDRLTAERKGEQFDEVHRQIMTLTELLNDFLMLSRLESVGVQVRTESTDLVALCEDVVSTARRTWMTHAIEFRAEAPASIVNVDQKMIRQAVSNLVTNAVKYSPGATPVTIAVMPRDTAITITVTDYGIGIPQADLVRLFEPFYRASNVGAIEGTGLGLAIVRRAMEAHNGSFTVDSTEGVGTTMTLCFPLS